MKNRIVLSSLTALLLLSVAACDSPAATSDDEQVVADGIGTSPSACVGACDPEGIAVTARLAPEPGVAPPSCGVWRDTSTAAADLRALACMPADAVVHVAGHTTCLDALALAGLHPAESVVRRLSYNGSAIEASCDAPGATPAMMLVEPPSVREPQVSGIDLWQLLVERGGQALKAALAALALAGTWLLVKVGASARWRALIEELAAHAKDVVQEVFQTYVEAIKEGQADGKLTADEKAAAKAMAIAKLRARLGWRKLLELGGGLLAKVIGGDAWEAKVEGWLSGAVETAVAEAKRDGKAAGLTTSGKDAPAPPADSISRLPLKAPPLPR